MATKQNKPGRPSKCTEKLAKDICHRLASGESLRAICLDEEMPNKSTVLRWLVNTDEKYKDFRDQYARARQIQAEIMIDEILDIADDGSNDWMEKETKNGNIYTIIDQESFQRSRLRVDTRKWIASKMLPKKYGDKLTQEHEMSGEVKVNVSINGRKITD